MGLDYTDRCHRYMESLMSLLAAAREMTHFCREEPVSQVPEEGCLNIRNPAMVQV